MGAHISNEISLSFVIKLAHTGVIHHDIIIRTYKSYWLMKTILSQKRPGIVECVGKSEMAWFVSNS